MPSILQLAKHLFSSGFPINSYKKVTVVIGGLSRVKFR
ncbi:hypothetical protein RINTHH_7690 [Richelia intracellularis HH01]|uniref:Uncharacterized protein n=2 Tax=Richelia TaxID=98443 RepID=M1WRG5_9NOST|nr:hypothetical protein RINTHH_7690 [Richelia intracellularis HH01]